MRCKQWMAACAAALGLLWPVATTADLQRNMQDMFNAMGAIGNVTAPGAFHSQAGNVITGGSLYVRAPQRGHPILNVQLPNLRAGCGGIDLFAGSFSFIDRRQFTAVLQGIARNALGYAFQLALSSITPQISGEIKDLMDKIQKMNNLAIDTCRTAQMMVDGAAGMMRSSQTQACQNRQLEEGEASDFADAMDRCNYTNDGNDGVNASVQANRDAANPARRDQVPARGNVIWRALKRITSLSDAERELAMSFIGTVVFVPAADDGNGARIQTYAATIETMDQLMYGNSVSGAATIQVPVLSCGGDLEECMNPHETLTAVTPFRELVRARLAQLSQNIVSGTPPSVADIGFVNNTSVPVYKMLAVANMRRNFGVADTLIERYRDVIAFDYVDVFVSTVLRSVSAAVAQSHFPSTLEQEQMREFQARLGRNRASFHAEKLKVNAQVANVRVVEEHIREIERNLMAEAPAALKLTIDYARAHSVHSRR